MPLKGEEDAICQRYNGCFGRRSVPMAEAGGGLVVETGGGLVVGHWTMSR